MPKTKRGKKPIKAGGKSAPAPSQALGSTTVLKLGQDELMAVAMHVAPGDRRMLRLACKAWHAATDAATGAPNTDNVTTGVTARSDLRSTPPPPPLSAGTQSAVQRIELSFSTPFLAATLQEEDKDDLRTTVIEGADQASLSSSLSSLQLGAVAPLHSTPAATDSAPAANSVEPAANGSPSTCRRTLALSLQGYETATKVVEDMLQQAGVLGAWPEVEVRPASLLLDGRLSAHLVVADVVGLAPGYVPGLGKGTASAYPNLRDLDLTLPRLPGVEANLLLNQHMLPNLRHLRLSATHGCLRLPMATLDLPSLQSLMMPTPYGTSFELRPREHQYLTPYCGFTTLTQLTRLVLTSCKDCVAVDGIYLLEALPSLQEMVLTQVPLDACFGHLTSLTRLSISFDTRYDDHMDTWDAAATVGHLTALRSFTLDCDDRAGPGPKLTAGALPALTELCFQDLNLSPSRVRYESLVWALPSLAKHFVMRCAPARLDSLRKVRFSPVYISNKEPEVVRMMAGGWAWAVKKQENASPPAAADAWEVEFEALDTLTG